MMKRWTGAPGSLRRSLTVLSGFLLVLSGAAAAAPAAAAEPQTIVSLTFDDGNADQMAAVQALDSAGLKGTFYIATGWVGAPGYFSRTQLNAIAADGNEIGGHSVTHPDLTTLPADEVARQICQSRQTLTDWGFRVTSFAYPYAAVDNAVEAAVKDCGFNSARGLGDIRSRFGCADCDYAESIPPADPYYTRALDEVDSSWTLADLQDAVTNAETHGGGWVQFTFHHICDDSCDSLGVTSSLFQDFVQWLAARAASHGTVVKTVDQVVGGAVKPVVPSSGTTPPAPAPGVNGIRNPGLEDIGSNGLPSCWMAGGYGTNTPAFSLVSPGHTGQYAERIIMTGYSSGDAKLLPTLDLGSCSTTVTPGHEYTLKGWYTSDTVTQFEVYLRDGDGYWRYWTASPWLAASPDYVEAAWQTPAVPAGSTGMSFGLNIFSNGTLTTDDYGLFDTTGDTGPTDPTDPGDPTDPPGTLTTATPTITGGTTVGQALSADPGSWGPGTVAFAYQWLRDGTPIDSATAASYTTTEADAGSTITVSVTGSESGYDSATMVSAPFGPIVAGTLTSATPTITGTAKVGKTLTAHPGTWGPGSVALAYQWLRGSQPIAGATGASYTAVAADQGARLRVTVTGSRTGYTTASRTSAATATVALGDLSAPAPVIQGTLRTGQKLTAIPGTWGPGTVTLSYQWLRNGRVISHATSASYTLTGADALSIITVRVTGAEPGYRTLVRSASISPIPVSHRGSAVSDPTASSSSDLPSSLADTGWSVGAAPLLAFGAVLLLALSLWHRLWPHRA